MKILLDYDGGLAIIKISLFRRRNSTCTVINSNNHHDAQTVITTDAKTIHHK